MPQFAEESRRDRRCFSLRRIPITGNRHPMEKQRGEPIPQARGAIALIFCPSRAVGKLPACAPGRRVWRQGRVSLRSAEVVGLQETGQQTSSTLRVQAPGEGRPGGAGMLLGPIPGSHQPCSSVRPHAAQRRGGRQRKSPRTPAASGVSAFGNARRRRPLGSPALPWRGPAAPPRAPQGAGVLLSAGRAHP